MLGDAGILVSDKDPYALPATSIGDLLADAPVLGAGLGGAGRRRLAELDLEFGRGPLREPAGPVRGRGPPGQAVSAIHQFVPMLHRSDAVGRHTLALRDVMAARGIASRIYVELVDPDTATETRPFASYGEEAAPGDVLVYQFATASGIASWLAGRPETLVVNYHNVTPPEFYVPWDNVMAWHQVRAQTELRRLAPRCRPRPRGVGL